MDTIKQSLLGFIDDKWQFSGYISRTIGDQLGKKESNIERRLRELENEGKIERRLVQINNQGSWVVQYKIKIKQTLF
jgi:predicted transcriptional regulator